MWRKISQRSYSKYLKLSDEVIKAKYGHKKLPIVALESTIISHGMPFPYNLKMAREVQDIIRHAGACPATICILDGKLHVGLNDIELQELAKFGTKAKKCSTRDIAAIIANKSLIGATTVSSTMRIAHAAGIQVFATGGLGGVHRGSSETMDISTDLIELARTPVAVVCAGVKSILDIPKTLEYLETNAVPVVGYKTNEFPAFYTTKSGSLAQLRYDTPKECAQLIANSKDINLTNGFVIGVPNPRPVPQDQIDYAINTALDEVERANIKGQHVTPYLLQRVSELTDGISLSSNIELVKNNARVAAEIAIELHYLNENQSTDAVDQEASQQSVSVYMSENISFPSPQVLVAGGIALDVTARCTSSVQTLTTGTSNIGEISQTSGGVGRNIAECLRRLNVTPYLVSRLGNDMAGKMLLQNLSDLKIPSSGIQQVENGSSAIYSAILQMSGDLEVAIADMKVFDDIDTSVSSIPEDMLGSMKIAIVDGNLTPKALHQLITRCSNANIPVWFEPTSLEKGIRLIQAQALNHVTYLSPNADELGALSQAILASRNNLPFHRSLKLEILERFHRLYNQNRADRIKGLGKSMRLTDEFRQQITVELVTVLLEMVIDKPPAIDDDMVKHVIVTMGRYGVIVGSINWRLKDQRKNGNVTDFPPPLPHDSSEAWFIECANGISIAIVHLEGKIVKAKDMISCTGAGDSLVGGTVYGLLEGKSIYESAELGMVAARASLQVSTPIHPQLSPDKLLNDFNSV